ncbi:M20/M25/M40 family metallo-hydrolase [Halegenticoccus tardaugens]|uniref:M20/M25/M40 family metallo-hydrolase n=1 Tax=Halegenticoccus tardaugens TaxID=2071624 RepID=UPI00100A61E0|nr:M20/M25/M40 family metallo-hydrolase [Halegenticoccus tardaugens]
MTFRDTYGDELRAFVESFLRFDTSGRNERPAQEWFADRLEGMGFETFVWTGDPERLAAHPSFPDDLADEHVLDRPSVGGVLEFGETAERPPAERSDGSDGRPGRTLVLNGHVDVVPVDRDSWTSDPFEPTWDGDELTARGAADMKCGTAVSVFAARYAADLAEEEGLDGRIVVESVAGEEDGGIGAAAAAMDNPYPFERDAAVVTEPTELRPVIATEGSVMKRLRLAGRSAHAARTWRGESVLPHFERIRAAFAELEAERAERVTHPLYERFDNPWPINFGTVEAGSWASSVPASLVAELRLGVAPGETVESVEAEFEEALGRVVADSEWLSAHPPSFDRFSVQFEAAETDADEPIVATLREAMDAHGLSSTEPRGETYGADSRHYVEAGIPTVVFGPGSVDQAHFPDETIDWEEVLVAGDVLAGTARRFLRAG